MVTPIAIKNKSILTHKTFTAKNTDINIVDQSIETIIILVFNGIDLSIWKSRTIVPKCLLLITLSYIFLEPLMYSHAVRR